jgi:hypothetical protein
MSRRCHAAVFALALPLAIEGRGFADRARSTVALVRTSSSDRVLREANTRLRAELIAAGFDVIEVERAPGDSRSEVEDASSNTGSFATIAISHASSGSFADVWISDHVTSKTVVRRLEVGDCPNATAVLAIRALELLRASLLEVAVEPSLSESPTSGSLPRQRPAPDDVVQWVAPALRPAPPRSLLGGRALSVGALALHGLGGIGLAVGPTISFSQGIGPWFGRATLAGPLIGPELRAAAGRATIRQEFAALAVGWASQSGPIGVQAWVGAGAFDLHHDGSAMAPYRGVSGDVLSFLGTAGLGGLARISERVALTADFAVLFLDPRPIVVIAGNDAGSAGAPSLEASVGMVVGL